MQVKLCDPCLTAFETVCVKCAIQIDVYFTLLYLNCEQGMLRLVRKCLWERRSHTKISMGTAFAAFPLHYTPGQKPLKVCHAESLCGPFPLVDCLYPARDIASGPGHCSLSLHFIKASNPLTRWFDGNYLMHLPSVA